MKLLTHNMLTSRCLKGVTTGYPLKIVANEVKDTKVDFNSEFVHRIIPKMDWTVLCDAAKNLGVVLPPEAPTGPADAAETQDTLKQIHHALLEIEVIEGELVCPETGRKFPIKQGIANMLCNEDEV
jgi:multifunctional methyltransferase subunit TRM112